MNINYIKKLLFADKLLYMHPKAIIENKKITFQNNYLNRVKAIDFILSSKSDFRTIQSLKQIKQLMNIEYIHIIKLSS